MTREEAIIEAGIEYSIQNSPYCIGGDNFYEKARELNRNKSFEAGVIWADKNPKSPWISVKDDLPCNHEEFIVVNDGDIITKNVYIFSEFFGFTTNYMEKKGNEWCWFLPFKGSITHWFPIPELPKE